MITAEQTTALTNVVLALVAGRLAWRARANPNRRLSAAFCAAAFTASAGAVFHGLRDVVPEIVLRGPWKMVLVGLAGTNALLALPAVYLAALDPRVERLILGLTCVKLVVTLAWSARSDSLTAAGVDFVLTLLLIGALEWRRAATRDDARWSLLGVAVTFLALVLQASGFRHGRLFGHNDAFHLLQATALVLFSAGLRHDPTIGSRLSPHQNLRDPA